MAALTEFKEAVQRIYARYDAYLIPLGKFLLALISFCVINGRLGQMKSLNNIIIVLILALLCSFLSANAIIVIGSGLILGHLYALSLPALVAGGGIVMIIFLLYFGISPKEPYALIFTMLALAVKMPCAVVIVLGLVAAPFSIVPVCFGTIVYYTIKNASAFAGQAVAQTGEKSLAVVGEIQQVLEAIVQEQEMVLMIIILAAVLVIVYIVRRMEIKYAWKAAVIAGTLTYLVIYAAGSLILGISGGILWAVLGSVLALAVGLATQLLLFHVDYKKTTSVQFEDNEYVYYVKAVPKIKKGSEMRD